MRRRGFCALLLIVLAGFAQGCESNEPSSIAGTWTATSFQFTETGQPPVNALALGAALSIAIDANNATTGSLTIPSELTGTSDITLSMAGTATRVGNEVEFQQSADTFVRDMTWTLAGNTMHAVDTFSGVTLDITLTRQ
jgi:hypothetical protein